MTAQLPVAISHELTAILGAARLGARLLRQSAAKESAMTTNLPPSAADRALKLATRLLREGFQLKQIDLQPDWRPPVIWLQNTVRAASLRGHRYAWGVNEQGRYERYMTWIDGVSIKWEVRHG